MNRNLSILIVEDEPLAAVKLAGLITKIDPNATILAVCDTVASTVEWINSNEKPDLALFDIHIGDGSSFDIFDQCIVPCPVIFTTAFDKYAIEAFKVNSVDYLLKPIEQSDLERAFDKFHSQDSLQAYKFESKLSDQLRSIVNKREYKERFLIKIGAKLRRVETKDIECFYSFDKATYLKIKEGKDYLIDHSLDTLERTLDPAKFFRVNRKYIIAIDSIQDITIYSSTKLKLSVTFIKDEDIFVSRDRIKDFKLWMEGEL